MIAAYAFLAALLGWLFSYMRRPDWDDGPLEILVTVHFLVARVACTRSVWQ